MDRKATTTDGNRGSVVTTQKYFTSVCIIIKAKLINLSELLALIGVSL